MSYLNVTQHWERTLLCPSYLQMSSNELFQTSYIFCRASFCIKSNPINVFFKCNTAVTHSSGVFTLIFTSKDCWFRQCCATVIISRLQFPLLLKFCVKVWPKLKKPSFLECHVILSPVNEPQGGIFASRDILTTEAPTWPSGAFSPSKQVALANTGHIPHAGVRGRLPSLPWILTAGTLSNSEMRPPFPETSEQQWCACEQVHQVSWVMNHRPLLPHSSLTHSLVISQLQTTHLLRKWALWARGNPEACWNNCF